MTYTVNKLAKLSGVSIRTLHYYDEIELLKPAYCGDNHYRYYKEEQLLMPQQILFFRELGFQLSDIKRIISSADFDKIETLKSHRAVLEKNLDQTKILIKTIDKTIAHLRGETNMKDEELYYGFDSERQKKYEQDLIDSGRVTEKEMKKYREIYKNYTKEDWDRFKEEGENIHDALVQAMKQKLNPDSKEVQHLIRRHHAWVGWNPTREKYTGLSQLYQTPEFGKFYNRFEPEFLPFLVESMKIFAERELA
jgi:DNA-binding transcriptional MerR regulator